MASKILDGIDLTDWNTRVFDCLSLPALILKPDKIIVDANKYFLEKFQLREEEIVGRTCHDFFYHSMESCPFDSCPLVQVLADREGHSALKYVTTPSGQEKWDNRVFSPILDDAGEVIYIVGYIHDFTPVKALERELSEARKLARETIESEKLTHEKRMREMLIRLARAEKLASLGQLAAGSAHEINNPMTGIIFYADLLLDTLEKDDPRRHSLTCIYEDARRCGKIIKNLLAYSRQETPSKEILHVNTLLEYSLDLIRDTKLFAGVTIIKEFADQMMLIEGDRDRLSQVVVNLVMNAMDAMDGKGTLTLRTYRNKPEKQVYLEVRDTGCGIPAENLSRIFDPFFTTKKVGKGTGLGLSTACDIVREAGGSLRVKESNSEGTTFLLELPLYQSPDGEVSSSPN